MVIYVSKKTLLHLEKIYILFDKYSKIIAAFYNDESD